MVISEYAMFFIIYSFMGWLYESIFYTLQFGKPVNTGFLRGCICPIYGFACVGNIALWGDVESGVKIFFGSMITISVMEYIVSWTLENRFDKRWWDYSEWPMNINGRVSVISSAAFGAMSYIQLRFIQPPVQGAVERMSAHMRSVMLVLFVVYVAVDLVYTVRCIERGEEEDEDRLWFVNEESQVSRRVNDRIAQKMQALSERLKRH